MIVISTYTTFAAVDYKDQWSLLPFSPQGHFETQAANKQPASNFPKRNRQEQDKDG
jgi:hypothetical protein